MRAINITKMTEDERLAVCRLVQDKDFNVFRSYLARILADLKDNAIYANGRDIQSEFLAMAKVLDGVSNRIEEASKPEARDATRAMDVEPPGELSGTPSGMATGNGLSPLL